MNNENRTHQTFEEKGFFKKYCINSDLSFALGCASNVNCVACDSFSKEQKNLKIGDFFGLFSKIRFNDRQELTITFVAVVELFMIFPSALPTIPTPVSRRITMPALSSRLPVSERREI